MYTHWATMDLDHPSLIVVPFNLMPTEIVPNPNPAEILEQRKFIKNRIVDVDNYTLRHDKDAWGLLTVLGSDLCINAFSFNFKINGIAKTGCRREQLHESPHLRGNFDDRCTRSRESRPTSAPHYHDYCYGASQVQGGFDELQEPSSPFRMSGSHCAVQLRHVSFPHRPQLPSYRRKSVPKCRRESVGGQKQEPSCL